MKPEIKILYRWMRQADIILRRRHELGLTQAALGERMRRSQSDIARWESGRIKPQRICVLQLEDALQLERGSLLE